MFSFPIIYYYICRECTSLKTWLNFTGVISSCPARVDSISSPSMTHCVHLRSRAVSEYVYIYIHTYTIFLSLQINNRYASSSFSVSYEQTAITYVWKNDEGTLRKSPSLTSLNAYLIKNQTITCPIKVSWRGEL